MDIRWLLRNIPQYVILSLLTALMFMSAVYLYRLSGNLSHRNDFAIVLACIVGLIFISMIFVIKNSYKETRERKKINYLRNLAEDNLLIAEKARAKAENFQLLAEKATNLAIEATKAAENANEAKSDFLANTTHEIKTPMGAIIGLSNLLLSTPLNDKQQLYLKTLKGSAEALITLVNDLLDLRKIESRRIELENVSFNLKELLGNIIGMMSVKAEEKGISLSLECDPALDKIFGGDLTHIRQIMINLIGNAIKFTERGGVSVVVQNAGIKGGKQKFYIKVEDTGVGIPEEKIGRIFDSFTQADSSIFKKYGGTGLGLSISKALAEALGGNITVQSTPGKGSIFTLHISLLPEPMNSQPS